MYKKVQIIKQKTKNIFNLVNNYKKKKKQNIRGSRRKAKLPMEFLVNTLLPFIRMYALLRIVVPYL